MEKPLTVQELAEFMQVTPKAVYKWVYEDRAPKITRIGKRVFFQQEHIREWLKAHEEHDEEQKEEK